MLLMKEGGDPSKVLQQGKGLKDYFLTVYLTKHRQIFRKKSNSKNEVSCQNIFLERYVIYVEV